MRKLLKFLRNIGRETHANERLAARWHVGHAVAYALLIGGYVCMIAFHWSAAQRHREAAMRKAQEEPPRFVG